MVDAAPVASSGSAGGSLYPSQPILADDFSSGALAPFVANNGLTPGGDWSVTDGALVAQDLGSTSPLQNQIASVPNMPENVVLDATFTINQVNLSQYYRIGLFGRASAPGTGSSQWDMVLDHGNLTFIDQYVNYPASVPFAISAGTTYQMMMVIDGNWVGGKVWAQGSAEPSQWTISGQFASQNLSSLGVAAGNADVTFHRFDVYPAPPALTVTPDQPNAIFSGAGPTTYTADLRANTSSEEGQYYVNYLVTGLNGETVTQGQVPVSLPQGGSAHASIVLPNNGYGYYNTTFSLTNQQSSLRYTPQFPTHSSAAPTAPTPPIPANTPAPGHTLNLLPAAPEQPAVPPADLAVSKTPAPMENSTTSMASVPIEPDASTVNPASAFGINGPGNRFGPITASLQAQWANAYQLFKKQGIDWVRTEFMWNYVEPSPGHYTWDTSDGLVEAGHASQVNLLGLVDYWGNYANPFTVNHGPQVSFSTFLQDYDQYIQALVKRYMPGGTLAQQMGWKHYGITAWEIWNEPSTPQFWPSENPTEYAELVQSASAAIKAVDPSATILAYDYTQSTLAAVSGPQSFTGVSIHYYPGPVSPSEAEFYGGVEGLRNFLGKNNMGQDPIWMTESGWSSNSITQTQQAEYLVRAEIQSLAGSLNKFFMFTWNYPGSGYGELNGQFLPKPVYPALAALSSQLTGYTSAGSVNPINMGSAIRAFAFQNGSSSLVALWSPTANGAISVAPPGNVHAYDWMGNAIAPSAGKLTVPLNGMPVYLVANMSASDLAALIQHGTITGIAPVAMAIQNLKGLPSALPHITMTITDQINTPQSGTLSLNLPSGWEATPSSSTSATYSPTVSFGPIDPSGTINESFGLTRFEANSANQYNITATATLDSTSTAGGPGASTSIGTGELGSNPPAPPTGSSPSAQTVSTSLPMSTFEAVYGSPALSGTFQDWGNASPFYLDHASQNVGIPDWSSSAESTTAYTMWNSKYFYFAAKVKDPVFYQPYTGFYIWEGDSIQMYWDPQDLKTDGFDYAAGDADLGLALTPDGPQAFRWSGPGYGLHSDVKLTIVHGKNAGDLWYEAAIPLSDLPDLTPTNGHQYGFDMLVNYNNGTGRLGWMWLTPGVGNAFSPVDFPTFTLVNSAGLASLLLNSSQSNGSVSFTPNAEGALLTVNNNGLTSMTVTLSNGTILTLNAEADASATVTPSGANPVVPILQGGTTTINLASYVTPGTAMSLSANTTVANNNASAIIAIDNGINP
jgi:hypothetical protein